jgi:hypothetical protein
MGDTNKQEAACDRWRVTVTGVEWFGRKMDSHHPWHVTYQVHK